MSDISPHAEQLPHPPRRSSHTLEIHRDKIFIYGGLGAPDECGEGGVCGDMWAFNLSGPASCPPPCSAHGRCEMGFCICDEGYLGELCDAKSCPNSRCFQDYANHRQVLPTPHTFARAHTRCTHANTHIGHIGVARVHGA